jgi:SAM-dependent methyltransferase
MTITSSPNEAGFDAFARNYDDALEQGISVSGEGKKYFARGRLAWLRECLAKIQESPNQALDYGCGTASSAPDFFELLGVRSFVGIDSSAKSIEIAKQTYGHLSARFLEFNDYQPSENMDLVFCNGVFHHIPPGSREVALDYVSRSVRRGGIFAFWENNPWNPGTRYVMSRIPFDRDAITLTPVEARRMLRNAGFEVLRIDFLFIFPSILRHLRFIEPLVSRLPFGAQYQILSRRM